MPTVSYPGVYVLEAPGGARPIDAAGTSTTAFVGLAERGPDTGAQAVTSWTQFQRIFGGSLPTGHLAPAVFHYFANGGRRCYIVRVTGARAARSSVTVQNRADPPTAGLVLTARSPGAWGDTLCVQIEDAPSAPDNLFRLSVRRQDDPFVVPVDLNGQPPLEVFDDLSADPAAPRFVGAVLAAESTLLDASVPAANVATDHGRLTGGATPALPLQDRTALQISLDGDGFQQVTLPAAAASSTTAADVASAVEAAVRTLAPRKGSTSADAFTGFTATIQGGQLVLSSGTTGAGSAVRVQTGGATDASALLRLDPGHNARTSDGLAVRRPAAAAVSRWATPRSPPRSWPSPPARTATRSAPSYLCRRVPRGSTRSPTSACWPCPARARTDHGQQRDGYCASRPLQDVFFLGEMAAPRRLRRRGEDLPHGRIGTKNSYGALYFPWLPGARPERTPAAPPIPVPPSGHIAGLYGRIDGVARRVEGAGGHGGGAAQASSASPRSSRDTDHGVLNPLGVDVIRRFPAAGIVAFGARTITADPAWRYVPVRRTAIMLRVSIYNGIQWAVFEPNDETLWSQLRLAITSFMTTLFRQGAFAGATAAEAFFVKCDGETTTHADVARGVVNVQVGFAPLQAGRVRRRHRSASWPARPRADVPRAERRPPMPRFTRQQHEVRPPAGVRVRGRDRQPVGRRAEQVQRAEEDHEVTPWFEGGDPAAPRQLPGTTTYDADHARGGVHLRPRPSRTGPTRSTTFRAAAASSLAGFRKDITIQVRNLQGKTVLAYNVHRCWVSEYQALPQLDASSNAVLISTVKIENEGWERDTTLVEPLET